ncbi:MAG: hypothetical protein IPP77_04815 [Bacteroidetes bacterium]|nr:hypothetical protein [Bacteroidota bacterium]
MGKTHYLKREKEGKIIQLHILTELGDEFGSVRRIKLDVDDRYKKLFPYIGYPIPHEELNEISFDEFRELCCNLNCLAHQGMPEPGVSTSDILRAKEIELKDNKYLVPPNNVSKKKRFSSFLKQFLF